MKRKIICLVLALLLMAAFAATVFAAGSASLSVSSKSANRGSTVTAVVKLSGIGKCNAGSVTVSWGSGLEWTNITCKVSGVTVVPDLAKGRAIFYSMSNMDLNAEAFVLTFKVKKDAAFAENKITVQLDVNGEKPTASAAVNVVCAHKYSAWADYSETQHTRKCSICGKSETKEHDFDNDCDTSCNSCGRERAITHKFSETWTGDETGHYHICGVCGTKDETAAHVPGPEAGEYTDQICTVCQYVLVPALGHTHKYDDTYAKDEDSHWQICTGCKEPTEEVAHVFDGNCDETCDTCGYQRQITHPVGPWEYSKDDHWKTCSNCSEKLEEGQHTWDAGYIKTQATTQNTGLTVYHCTVCMAERQEVVPKALPTDPAGGWAWWIWTVIGAGGGIVLTAGIGTLIIVLSARGKRSKGRFSN